MKSRLGTVAVVALGLVPFASGCGGDGGDDGGSEADKAADAAKADLSKTNDLHIGLNTDGIIVGVREGATSYFQLGQKRLENIEVSNVKVNDSTARGSVSFRVTSDGGSAQCRGGVGLTKRDSGWRLAILTVSSCG